MKPDLDGFRDAAVRMRQEMGSDVPFFTKSAGAYPPGTPIDPETQRPFDPTVPELGSAMGSAILRVGVYTANVTGTRSDDQILTPAGWFEHGNIVLDVDPDEYAGVADASMVEWHDEFYEIADVDSSSIDDVEHRKLVFARKM